MISIDMRPRLAGKARLRFDRKGERYMLFYLEKGFVLNDIVAVVVKLCTGEHTVGAIVDRLAAKYAPQPREDVAREILAFLAQMAERGLIRSGDE